MIGIDFGSIDGKSMPDFRAAYGAGARFAIFRDAYGTSDDPTFERLVKPAIDAGLTVGAYLYQRTDSAAPAVSLQAAMMRHLDPSLYPPGMLLPPTLDVEHGSAALKARAPADLVTLHEAARQLLELQHGVPPMIYTSRRVIVEDLRSATPAAWGRSPAWLAKPWVLATRRPWQVPTGAPLVPTSIWGDTANWWLYQAQGDATGFPGIGRTVDVNLFHTAPAAALVGARRQWVLQRLGATTEAVTVPQLHDAIRVFQRAHSLFVDGVIGVRTFAALAWERVGAPTVH